MTWMIFYKCRWCGENFWLQSLTFAEEEDEAIQRKIMAGEAINARLEPHDCGKGRGGDVQVGLADPIGFRPDIWGETAKKEILGESHGKKD